MSHPPGSLRFMDTYPLPSWATLRSGAHRVALPSVAAEGRGGYDPAAAQPSVDGRAVTSEGPPFGLPVLAEVPELAGVLAAIDGAERRLLEAVVGVSRLLACDEVAQATGVPVEHWLAIVCRQTRLDRRLLLRLARLIDRFPTLRGAVADGRVSFAQLRGLGIVLRDAPVAIDVELDMLLTRLVAELVGADPDVLIDQTRRAICELAPTISREETEPVRNTLYLQPNLLRTGGRFGGEYGAAGLAILDEATAPIREQLDHPGGSSGARADNLLTRLLRDDDAGPVPAADAGGSHAAATADPAAAHNDTSAAPGTTANDRDGAGVADGGAAQPGLRGGVPGGLLPPVKLLARYPARNARPAARRSDHPADRRAPQTVHRRRQTAARPTRRATPDRGRPRSGRRRRTRHPAGARLDGRCHPRHPRHLQRTVVRPPRTWRRHRPRPTLVATRRPRPVRVDRHRQHRPPVRFHQP